MLIRRVTGLSPAHVERLITARRCRLLLDALNECPDALRIAATHSIGNLLRTYPNLYVVITARTPDTTAHFQLPTFAVEPLSPEQRRAFLVAYLKDSQAAEALLGRIASQPGGESLASNPLLLRMIVEVARSGKDLPIGRATLYRRWIDEWYKRERRKAENAGDPLTWTPEQTRITLAAIALASRREGNRYASDDLAFDCIAPLVEKPERFLDRMTQGPLILREEGRIEFRHETFQEYLCAEALLANPEAIPTKILSDKTTWGMVMVQAAQLCDGKLPEPLADAAWAMDPWLGAALDPREELPAQTKEVVKTWASHERHALYDFCGGGITKKLSGYILNHYFRRGGIAKKLSGCGGRYWYDAKDPALREAVEVISGVRNRWQNFEATLLGSVVGRPGCARRLLEWLLCSGPELLKVVCPERDGKAPVFWIERANPINAQKFVQLGLFSAQDFEHRRPKWIATATPRQAIALIEAGICSPQDFAERMQQWATKKDCSRRLKKTIIELIRLLPNKPEIITQMNGQINQNLTPFNNEWKAPAKSDLDDPMVRDSADKSLKGVFFEGTVASVFGKGLFCLIQHPAFPDNVSCPSSVWPAQAPAMREGLSVRFVAKISFDEKKQHWGFSASQVEVLEDLKPEGEQTLIHKPLPALQLQAAKIAILRRLIPRLLKASRTRKPHPFVPSLVDEARKIGIDANVFLNWIPNDNESGSLEIIQFVLGNLHQFPKGDCSK